MPTYISMLRGINVSGQKMIKMDALRAAYESLGFSNVQSYIQSGNVLFKYKKTDYKKLESSIKTKIKDAFGFDVPVLVKELEELKFVLANNPFVKDRNEDISRIYVTFLDELPEPERISKIDLGTLTDDEFFVNEKTIYLFCPKGYGTTKLSNNFFETKLKTMATTRNWKTVTELARMAEAIKS